VANAVGDGQPAANLLQWPELPVAVIVALAAATSYVAVFAVIAASLDGSSS